jgi:hypothetical protein
MLTQLDTVIGFAVVMSVVSILIMVATQIFSALLGLRGKNLGDALETMFHQVAPGTDKAGCLHLINTVLTDPAISDSTLSMTKPDGWLVSIIPGMSWLRARMKKANAIRHGELFDYLQEKAQGPVARALNVSDDVARSLEQARAAIHSHVQTSPFTNDLRMAVSRLEASINALEGVRRSIASSEATSLLSHSLDGAFTAAEGALAAVTGIDSANIPKSAAFSIKNARTSLLTMASIKQDYERVRASTLGAHHWPAFVRASLTARHIVSSIRAKVASTAAATSATAATAVEFEERVRAHFEKRFNSAQDRAQEWFTVHARTMTIIGAIAAAVFLQLDTISLVQTISSNPEVRAKLVARADSIERQAQDTANQVVDPITHSNVMALLRKWYRGKALPPALDTLPGVLSQADVEKWIGDTLNANGYSDRAAIVTRYHSLSIVSGFGKFKTILDETGKANASTGLGIVPDPYPLAFNETWPTPHFWKIVRTEGDYWANPWRRLAGILLSAALLSLGGPFWFNILRQMSDLRPSLADAMDAEAKNKTGTGGQPQPGAPAK